MMVKLILPIVLHIDLEDREMAERTPMVIDTTGRPLNPPFLVFPNLTIGRC